jgi:hypothetical protein
MISSSLSLTALSRSLSVLVYESYYSLLIVSQPLTFPLVYAVYTDHQHSRCLSQPGHLILALKPFVMFVNQVSLGNSAEQFSDTLPCAYGDTQWKYPPTQPKKHSTHCT